MGIKIKEIRIRNFRAFKSIDIDLTNNTVLIGANNVGKTSLLQAIQIALGGIKRVSSEDIYIKADEVLPKDRKAIIDILMVPVDENKNEINEFDDVWFEHFGELRSENANDLSQFVAIRTIISFDMIKGEYELEKKGLIEWTKSENVEIYQDYKKSRITDKILQAIPVFYMDAKRDISSEMKEKTSYWGKMVTDIGLNENDIEKMEGVLDSINNEIINKSTVLKHLSKNLSEISVTVDSEEDSVKINPVSRKIRDLNRGINITFKDKDSESFPISNHGMGTRSWITFLTLVAYVTWKVEQMKDEKIPYHPIILLEEPESHLHPHAQRQIFKQMNNMLGQKIISSHSPMIVGQAEIEDIRHISKEKGISTINSMNMNGLVTEDFRRIKQEVFKSRGDLLFAKALLLCEGETEEQSLPIFFKEYFGCETFEAGINIIGVNGYGNYKAFLNVAKSFNIHFYILSDGERDTIKKVKKDIKTVFGEEKAVDNYSNIKYLDDGADFEMYLLNSGYYNELNIVMERLLGTSYLVDHIRMKDKTSKGRTKTSKKCDKCKQFIFKDELRDYSGDEGAKRALLDCIHNNKTAYSSIIADVIIENRKENKIPPIIKELFEEIEKDLRIKRKK